MIDVFVNYRTVDTRFGAASAHAELARHFGDDRVFLDNQSISPGELFPERIREALEQARVLVVLIGPDWLCVEPGTTRRLIDRDDDWVREEIRCALQREILVVPVLLDGTRMPEHDELPEDIRGLVLHQAVEVRASSLRADLARVVDAVARAGIPIGTNSPDGAGERLVDAVIDPAPLLDDLDLSHFTGRDWLIQHIRSAISQRNKGYVLVLSEAGVGKTCLAAQLARTTDWVHHFTAFAGGANPETARKNLAAQLVHKWHLQDRLRLSGGVLPESAERPDWLVKVLHAAAAERDEMAETPPLVLLVDGLDEAEPPVRGCDTGIPLGLPMPAHLPSGVYIVATSRYGVNLSSLRAQAEVLEIHVDGPDNRDDLLNYLRKRAEENGSALLDALEASRVPKDQFVNTLAERCGGVWIYARYVLDEIVQGTRSPEEVGRLPNGLAGYYEQQINRWGDTANWDSVGEPLLATLAAVQGPAYADVLADIAGVDERPARRWLDQAFRPFLSRAEDAYAIRHQSLRDLFDTKSEDELDAGLRRELSRALVTAHGRVAEWLIPPDGDWTDVGDYARYWLPQHAAASGRLDELVGSTGFLLSVEPLALLRHRGDLITAAARRALGTFELALHDWRREPARERRLWWLHIHARKNRCPELAEACAVGQPWPWRLRVAMWSGVRCVSTRTGEHT